VNPFVDEIVSKLDALLPLGRAEIERMIETPPDRTMGEYSFPCFALAKIMRKAPQKIAEEVAASFATSERVPEVKNVNAYVNFFVNPRTFAEYVLKRVFDEGESYGRSDTGAGKCIVLDYSSPNIAKHLAIYHLWSTCIGNCLYKLFETLGYRCVGINYLGDWGTQFGRLIVAWKKWGKEEELRKNAVRYLNELYVKFHSEAEEDALLNDEAREAFKKLESGDAETVQLWRRFRDVSLEEFNRVYERLGVRFDVITGESFYNDKMEATIKRIEEKGLCRISEGALIVDLEAHDMPPCLLKKKDGATLYATRDICAAEHRYETYRFDKLLYVVGSEQKLHLRQVFKVLELMGYEWAKNCRHVEFGMVSFKDRKMSTRKGEVVLLQDVLDRAAQLVEEIIRENEDRSLPEEEIPRTADVVGTGAVIFAGLNKKRAKDMVFDWGEVLNFRGDTGPYLQYTHARICSILRKYGRTVSSEVDFAALSDEYSIALVKEIERFPHVLVLAARECEPSVLCGYLLKLCSALNIFYQHNRVLTDDERLSAARILLVDATRQVIRNGLALLGIQAPERM